MRTVAIVQARMTSSRLPGKVLLPLAGRAMIDRVIDRLQLCHHLDALSVALPHGDKQAPLAAHLARRDDIRVTRGDENDVLARTLEAAHDSQADVIVRVTSDCPFIDPDVVDAVIVARAALEFDYARTAMLQGWPLGYDCEAFKRDALESAARESSDPYEREHVTPFIWRRPERFSTLVLDHLPDRRHWRLVVDSEEDYRFACHVYDGLSSLARPFRHADLVSHLEAHADLFAINQHVVQNPYRW